MIDEQQAVATIEEANLVAAATLPKWWMVDVHTGERLHWVPARTGEIALDLCRLQKPDLADRVRVVPVIEPDDFINPAGYEAPAPPPKPSRAERLLEEELWYASKIGDALAFEEKCRDAWERAKDRAKECKELLDGASASLRSIIKDRAKLEDRPILTACEPIEEPSPVDDDDDEDEVEDDGQEEDDRHLLDWRHVHLRDVLSPLSATRVAEIIDAVGATVDAELSPIPPGKEDRYAVLAMDAVHDLFAAGTTIDALALGDEAKVDLLEALRDWARGYRWHVDLGYPDAFPVDFLTTKFHDLEKVAKRVKARAKKAALRGGGGRDDAAE